MPAHLACTLPQRRCGRSRQRGSVLIYVVWVLMLLSLFGASVGSQGLFAVDLAERVSEQLKAAYIARAAVQYAALTLKQDESPLVDSLNDQWSNNPQVFQERRVADGQFRIVGHGPVPGQPWYGLTDEERRVNLNTAPVDVLERLAEEVGELRPFEAAEVADAIADWRDEDHDRRPAGAENSSYRSLGYDAKDGPFENLEELLLVKGVSPELYRRLEEVVTVYGSGQVNLNTASERVLQALGLSEAAIQGFLEFRAGPDGVPGTPDDGRLVSIHTLADDLKAIMPAHDITRLEQLAQQKFLGVRSHDFRMTIEAQTARAPSRITVACVLDRDGHVNLWDER